MAVPCPCRDLDAESYLIRVPDLHAMRLNLRFHPFLGICYHGFRLLFDADLFVDGESLSHTLIHVVVLVGC